VTIEFGRRATAQLAAIFSSIAKDDPRAAANVVARIEEIADLLGDFPEAGQPARRQPRLRWIAVPRTPYLIFYTILRGRTVRIVRVLHGARQRHRS
jgi:plasmid stabilization system protein ParE